MHISYTDVTKVFSCTISCLGIWMYFNNNYLNVIHVLQCTENILLNTVPMQSLKKAYRNLQIWQTCTIHLTTDIQIQNLKQRCPPPPLPIHNVTHATFCKYSYTCMKSRGQVQQRNTLEPVQILINTHMTSPLKRKYLGSKVPLDLSVDQFYINSIMRVWTLTAGMQSSADSILFFLYKNRLFNTMN